MQKIVIWVFSMLDQEYWELLINSTNSYISFITLSHKHNLSYELKTEIVLMWLRVKEVEIHIF